RGRAQAVAARPAAERAARQPAALHAGAERHRRGNRADAGPARWRDRRPAQELSTGETCQTPSGCQTPHDTIITGIEQVSDTHRVSDSFLQLGASNASLAAAPPRKRI